MKKKTYFFLIILTFLLLPILNTYAQNSRAGFIPGNIWYSKEPLEERDKVKIYTALFNPDIREFSGTIIFFDKSTFLGKKNFIVNPRSVKDVSIDWTVTLGSHNIFAKLENTRFLISPGKYEEVYLAGNQSEESKVVINKKVIPSDSLLAKSADILDKSSNTVEDLGKTIEYKTPDILKAPIINTVDNLEKLRDNITNISENQKETIKKELKNTKKSGDDNLEEGRLATPFKYMKLFFFTLTAFIFSKGIVFYGLVVLVLFLILRYIWRLIF